MIMGTAPLKNFLPFTSGSLSSSKQPQCPSSQCSAPLFLHHNGVTDSTRCLAVPKTIRLKINLTATSNEVFLLKLATNPLFPADLVVKNRVYVKIKIS